MAYRDEIIHPKSFERPGIRHALAHLLGGGCWHSTDRPIPQKEHGPFLVQRQAIPPPPPRNPMLWTYERCCVCGRERPGE